MRQTRTIEISTGVLIILAFVALFLFAMHITRATGYSTNGGYTVTAGFTNIGHLKVRAPVVMSGVTVGSVSSIHLDAKTFRAVVTMKINNQFNDIPYDSSASILTKSLIGEQYIGISPGGSDSELKNGSKIQITQSAIVLDKLLRQISPSKSRPGTQ